MGSPGRTRIAAVSRENLGLRQRGPLKGITVLDLTTNISGPLATHVLSGLGARVWKVERPDGGDDARQMAPVVGSESAYFIAINTLKKSIALDLKNRGSSVIVKRLVEHVDILVENYRPGVAAKLGVGWRRVRGINPKLIYASISGYGERGPDRLRAGYDALLQARTGLVSVTGRPRQSPVRIGVSILDAGSGVWAALGILAALRTRDRTKRGQLISTSLFETGVFLFAYHLLSYQLTGRLPLPQGTEHPAFSPYGSFSTSQDGTIFVGVSNDRQFARLCRCLGRSAWASDPQYQTNKNRVANRDQLNRMLDSILGKKDAESWERILTKAGVPSARLQNAPEVLDDVQAESLSLFQTTEGPEGRLLKVPRLPLRFSKSVTGGAPRAPHLGEHTREVMTSIGFTGSEIAQFEHEGVVSQFKRIET